MADAQAQPKPDAPSHAQGFTFTLEQQEGYEFRVKFVGSTIVYSHMQATGMVNDHLVTCFRYRELTRKAGAGR